jgi:hypothetical protein
LRNPATGFISRLCSCNRTICFLHHDGGLALFDAEGQPISGDRTTEVVLWDAGTEINETPGIGLNQLPRQATPNIGPDESGVLRPLIDGLSYLPVGEVIRVTIKPTQSGNERPVSAQ